MTHPLSKGRQKIGFDTRIGLKVNLQPKLSMESLKNETDTIGLLKKFTVRKMFDYFNIWLMEFKGNNIFILHSLRII